MAELGWMTCCGVAEVHSLDHGHVSYLLDQARILKKGYLIAFFLDYQLDGNLAKEMKAHGFQFGERFKNPNTGNWLTPVSYALTAKEKGL